MDNSYLLIYCTCPEQALAERLAEALVEDRLAACINIVPGITSVYRWQGEVQHDSELLLLIKTRGECYPALEARIRELHSYEVPEIIAVPIQRGSGAYLAWIDASVGAAS
ncbi:MAG: divalent-cation tolerance protein CutA [Candidatus Competibacteraceae bacterium]